jgi:hypothetical protein
MNVHIACVVAEAVRNVSNKGECFIDMDLNNHLIHVFIDRDVESAMEAIRWLGLLEEDANSFVWKDNMPPFDALCSLLEKRLQYKATCV